MKKKCLLLYLICLICLTQVQAQPCGSTVNSFPYQEGFEASAGNWVTGGTASDWTWGQPTKTVISSAGQGNNCWITGGLSGNGYNNGEASWLLSPCFDFTTLLFPVISFKVFWETEHRFDGAQLQYSTDGGSTWATLGAANNNNCDIANWYNHAGITYLGNAPGWSGNVQPTAGSCQGGNGSGGWVTARHPLNGLGGQASVRFRFRFGAGTTCNAYNGFAIDDIEIKEATAASFSIDKVCQSSSAIQFSAVGTCITGYQWNFGDAASGSNNTSTAATPVHQFSAPGTYTVSLQATFSNGATGTQSTQVVIIGATQTTVWPGACNNTPNATLTVTPTGSNNPYIFSWDTNPVQTGASISNVGAGTYTVYISSQDACSLTQTFNLVASGNIEINPVLSNSICGPGKGSVITTVAGGTAPYSFVWSNGATTSAITQLPAGTYAVVVTDANGCSQPGGPFVIVNEDRQLNVNLGPDQSICPSQTIVLSPGNYAGYLWQDGSTAAQLSVNSAGNYSVTVTDAMGCSGSDAVVITAANCSALFFPSAFTPNGDGLNDAFGALGNTAQASDFLLQVFDRYGNKVFSSHDVNKKWDGQYKGKHPLQGNYVWQVSYTLNGRQYHQSGSLLLIR